METTAYLRQLAEQGDAEAQFRIGYRLAFGKKSPKPRNWVTIVAWWQKAAGQGVRRAKFYLGTYCEFGRGVEQNMEQAFLWYLEAANDGQVDAQYNVGFCYREGDGVMQNCQAAAEWFAKAARKGDEDAQRELGYSLFYGRGVPQDKKQAVSWYRKAAKAGDAKAQYNLALCYQEGEGVKESEKWEKYWLQQAAQQGHRQARKRLQQLDKAKDSQPEPIKSRKKLGYFCVKMTVAIQHEGDRTGRQLYEERYVLYRAHSAEEATARAEAAAPDYGKPYLNSDKRLVRWKMESVDDVYEVVSDNARNLDGAEVFSILKKRKLTPSRAWQ